MNVTSMTRYLRRPPVLRAILFGILVVSLSVMAIMVTVRPSELMARYLSRQLAVVPDRLVPDHVDQIAELDLDGTRVLVRALGSEREVVARSAGDGLHAQLDQWTALPLSESRPRVLELARLLAARVDRLDARSRSVAADLAIRILHWPVTSSSVLGPEFVTYCERVLRAVPETQGGQTASRSVPHQDLSLNRNDSHRVPGTQDLGQALQLPLADVDGAPGGNLPIEEVEIPSWPPSLATSPSREHVTGDESRLMASPNRRAPRAIFSDKSEHEGGAASSDRPPPRQLPVDVEDDAERNYVSRMSATRQDRKLERLSDLELIRQLTGSSSTTVSAVERELRRRGFNELQLSMARRVADPDPRIRRQLCESLAKLPTSPGPWLFWLSYDPDPAVRRLAVSLMSTSQNPRLHRRLREMQSSETDERVRRQLSRLPEQHLRR